MRTDGKALERTHWRWMDRSYFGWLRYQIAIDRHNIKPGMYRRISPFAEIEGK